ncbi:hypothetical protein THS27_02080 [Thalassospira sp. MCCC 1A01428]|nr:hypothetical protein THS27_02080 [Thalassospira sp. MCCC 1A01428]
MYMMYVDESGDSGVSTLQTNHFILTGLVIHETRWHDFIDVLLNMKKTFKSVYGLPMRTEIHASEYLRKPVHDIEKHKRLSILRNVVDEVAKYDFISITNIVVRKQDKSVDYDVFLRAWQVLFQRFENTLRNGNFPGGYRDDYGQVFTDATSGEKLIKLMRKMSVYNPVPNRLEYGGGYRNLPIRRIIEDPHEKDSRNSLPIQVCDVCAYFLQQYYSPNGYIRRKRASKYFERLDPVLNKRASVAHPMGIVEI